MTSQKYFNYALSLLYLIFGLYIFCYLNFMLIRYPLFDFSVTDIDWTREWLYMTVLDYYGVALCLSLVALKSEPILNGILWSLAFCLLGSPTCCLYVVYRLLFKSLTLVETNTYSRLSDK